MGQHGQEHPLGGGSWPTLPRLLGPACELGQQLPTKAVLACAVPGGQQPAVRPACTTAQPLEPSNNTGRELPQSHVPAGLSPGTV